MKIKYKVNKHCWECTSHCQDINGYPVATIKGKWNRIHRHFYRKYKGKIPLGGVVRHTCDNRKCINPNHLIVGSHVDNVRDRVARNRSAKGTANGRSKLQIDEVELIKKDNCTPKMALARKFGVDPKTIRDIQQGKTWINTDL